MERILFVCKRAITTYKKQHYTPPIVERGVKVKNNKKTLFEGERREGGGGGGRSGKEIGSEKKSNCIGWLISCPLLFLSLFLAHFSFFHLSTLFFPFLQQTDHSARILFFSLSARCAPQPAHTRGRDDEKEDKHKLLRTEEISLSLLIPHPTLSHPASSFPSHSSISPPPPTQLRPLC